MRTGPGARSVRLAQDKYRGAGGGCSNGRIPRWRAQRESPALGFSERGPQRGYAGCRSQEQKLTGWALCVAHRAQLCSGEGLVLLPQKVPEHFSRMQLRPHLAQPFLPPCLSYQNPGPGSLSSFLHQSPLSRGEAVISCPGASLLLPCDPGQLKVKGLHLINS